MIPGLRPRTADPQDDSPRSARIWRTNSIANGDIDPQKWPLEGYGPPEARRRAGFEESRHRPDHKLLEGTGRRGSDPLRKRHLPS